MPEHGLWPGGKHIGNYSKQWNVQPLSSLACHAGVVMWCGPDFGLVPAARFEVEAGSGGTGSFDLLAPVTAGEMEVGHPAHVGSRRE